MNLPIKSWLSLQALSLKRNQMWNKANSWISAVKTLLSIDKSHLPAFLRFLSEIWNQLCLWTFLCLSIRIEELRNWQRMNTKKFLLRWTKNSKNYWLQMKTWKGPSVRWKIKARSHMEQKSPPMTSRKLLGSRIESMQRKSISQR